MYDITYSTIGIFISILFSEEFNLYDFVKVHPKIRAQIIWYVSKKFYNGCEGAPDTSIKIRMR